MRSRRRVRPIRSGVHRGPRSDPEVLFGPAKHGRARISVISLIGLSGLEAQRAFLNQLAMTLFTWIKKNPDPAPRPLRGLLVIDEAKDYVPSQGGSACKESLTRLTAQARKYHLGLVYATQSPREIDHKILGNCSTHFYGKVNSPAAIQTIKELLQKKGSNGGDVARLPRGVFYVHNADAGMNAPAKVLIPLCLSHHPSNPLDEGAIIEKGASSQRSLRG